MSNSDADEQKAEELLQQSKEQRRHTSNPSGSESQDDNESDLTSAIKQALGEIDEGDRHENVTVRDAKYAALFAGLDADGGLDELSRDALTHLDELEADVDGDLDTRATAIRLLIKVGINEVNPGLMATFEEAGREYQREKADDFSL